MKKYILILAGFALCFVIGFFFQVKREKKLENTKETEAIIVDRDKHLTKAFGAKVRFIINGKVYSTEVHCDCRSLEIGDTVLIKYAVEDPELSLMVDKHYMQKYNE